MATLSTQAPGHAGAHVTFAAATGGGDKCATGAGVALLVINGDASSKTVTLVTPGTVDTLAIGDRAVVVPAGETWAIPVPDLYKNTSDGLASITYSAVTSVTVACVRVP